MITERKWGVVSSFGKRLTREQEAAIHHSLPNCFSVSSLTFGWDSFRAMPQGLKTLIYPQLLLCFQSANERHSPLKKAKHC